MSKRVNHAPLFAAYDAHCTARRNAQAQLSEVHNSLEAFLHGFTTDKASNGFKRMQLCRDALEAIDRRGYQRSFHQRLFHDNFIRACARIFWKMEPPGTFARNHQKILEVNGWDNLSQEILVSTPRRLHFVRCLNRREGVHPSRSVRHPIRVLIPQASVDHKVPMLTVVPRAPSRPLVS
jgi:hypothetical protein